MSSTVVIPDADVEWTSLEKLALVSAVVKKGDSSWPTVSRLIRPYISPSKNVELFSAKNCALKYDHLLEQLEKTKDQKVLLCEQSSPADQVLKLVTAERIAELKTKVQKLHANCTQLHVELNEVNSGKYNSHIEVAWDEVQKRKHSQEFESLSVLVSNIMSQKKAKEEPKQSSTKVKEEVLDEGHSSSTSSKSDKASMKYVPVTESKPSLLPSTSPAPTIVSTSLQLTTTGPPNIPSKNSPLGSSPGRGPRLVQSPRLPGTSRVVSNKTKHPDGDKSKVKTIKPQKKKPVVPKIKIKALQMAGGVDPKGVSKGDKKESKITDVFHFDYQPPSGSGSNPNAQYSSLYQDSKMVGGLSSDKSDGQMPESANSSACSTPVMEQSPNIETDVLDIDSPSYRAWKKSILLLWKTAAQHKYAHIFMHPVTDELAPNYSATVRRPIDLSTIKRKIDSNEIRTTAQFHRDMLLMFHNALMYNNASHSVYTYTVSMMDDVVEVIQTFYNTHNQAPDKHLQKSRSRAGSVPT